MTENETTAETSRARRYYAGLLRFCKHPASVLVWFCLISLIVKEQFPFSHYPMYSGWSDRTHYFYIACQDEPIETKSIFKVSVPRIKKLYGNLVDDVAAERKKKLGGKFEGLNEADHGEAGRRLLRQLRKEAPENRRKKFAAIMDRDLTLVRVEIVHEDGKFTTSSYPVITTGADNEIVTPKKKPETGP